jgi:hypothetical protein
MIGMHREVNINAICRHERCQTTLSFSNLFYVAGRFSDHDATQWTRYLSLPQKYSRVNYYYVSSRKLTLSNHIHRISSSVGPFYFLDPSQGQPHAVFIDIPPSEASGLVRRMVLHLSCAWSQPQPIQGLTPYHKQGTG